MTTILHDFSDDPNPYREAIPMRSRADAPECNPASKRMRYPDVPPLPDDFAGMCDELDGSPDLGWLIFAIVAVLWIAVAVAAYWLL